MAHCICCVHCGEQTRLLQQPAQQHDGAELWSSYSGKKTPWHMFEPVPLMTGVLQELHWLPIRHCVWFKLVAITLKSTHSGLPAYLHDALQHDYQPTRIVRSFTADLHCRCILHLHCHCIYYLKLNLTVWTVHTCLGYLGWFSIITMVYMWLLALYKLFSSSSNTIKSYILWTMTHDWKCTMYV